MQVDWSPLRRELALWRAQGLRLPLWWRDDDAVAATPELEQLARLSKDLGLPVHLAVIPDGVEPSLSRFLAAPSPFIPTIHGWAHRNTALVDAKKSEFGYRRQGAEHELENALTKMQTLFGSSLVRAFVAPWNRLHPTYLPTLAGLGYDIVSTFRARDTVHPVAGILAINTHIDPIDWRGSRGLVDPDIIIALAVQQLTDRRIGRVDNSEPFGYLTHHLAHHSDVWRFSAAFLSELREGGAESKPLATVLEETK